MNYTGLKELAEQRLTQARERFARREQRDLVQLWALGGARQGSYCYTLPDGSPAYRRDLTGPQKEERRKILNRLLKRNSILRQMEAEFEAMPDDRGGSLPQFVAVSSAVTLEPRNEVADPLGPVPSTSSASVVHPDNSPILRAALTAPPLDGPSQQPANNHVGDPAVMPGSSRPHLVAVQHDASDHHLEVGQPQAAIQYQAANYYQAASHHQVVDRPHTADFHERFTPAEQQASRYLEATRRTTRTLEMFNHCPYCYSFWDNFTSYWQELIHADRPICQQEGHHAN